MEQVPAILTDDAGRSFGQYIGGLAALGYDLVWHCIPACAVGSNIERDRVWIIAKSNKVDGQAGMGNQQKRSGEVQLYNPAERIPIWIQATGQFVGMGNGFSDQLYRNRVEAIGNAVIPQIPFLIGQAINQIEGF
jgi:DNA (cytosine-5)-methyltransferase 1